MVDGRTKLKMRRVAVQWGPHERAGTSTRGVIALTGHVARERRGRPPHPDYRKSSPFPSFIKAGCWDFSPDKGDREGFRNGLDPGSPLLLRPGRQRDLVIRESLD